MQLSLMGLSWRPTGDCRNITCESDGQNDANESQAARRPARRLSPPGPRHPADPARADEATDGASRRPRLWVKREDATGLGFGGNKLRKLDYVLHEALAKGADTIVSGGVVQSNSQRQVAAAAAKLGLACHLAVYQGRLAPPAPEYKTSGNAFLNRLFGAHLHDVPWTGDRN